MGAWGEGSFENDTALDWAAGVKSAEDVSVPFLRFKEHCGGKPGDLIEPIDADMASELIAAAETVAMMMGRKIPGFPPELEQAVGGAQDIDKLLYHRARNATLCVLRNSELAELWAEAAENTGENDWQVEITGLIDRLNPEIEYSAPTQEELDMMVGEVVDPCIFCNQPVGNQERYAITLADMTSLERLRPSFSMHVDCFNRRVHHKHVWHDMRHDPDDADFDLDQI